MSDAAARNAWVERVLGVAVSGAGARSGADAGQAAQPGDASDTSAALAASAARAKEAQPGKGRGVAYGKLLLRWRDAQALFDANLKAVGTTLLARPDIQADPRIDAIKQAVADLPKLVPQFGGKLEDVLDAGLNAEDPAETARLATEGIAAIDAYRQQLTAASHLIELEQFAAKDLGAGLPLHGTLDQALADLKQQLAG